MGEKDDEDGIHNLHAARGVGGVAVKARAAQRGFNVSKPWGDSSRYDVSVEDEPKFRPVQNKSTDVARGEEGFFCLKRTGIQYYRIEEVDFFAIYVVRKDAWVILPAKVVLRLKSNIRVATGNKKQKYARCEGAWDLLLKRGTGWGEQTEREIRRWRSGGQQTLRWRRFQWRR